MTRRPGKQAMADVHAAAPPHQWEREEEEEENVTRRAGKELVEDDVPAAPPLQREDEESNENKNKRTRKRKTIQVEPRHNMVKYHLGSYKDKWGANFAWDFSLFLKRSFQPPSEKDKYHYRWSPIIFEKFECLPDKPALVPIYKQLCLQHICGKGESKDEKLAQFCEDARNRIKEMMPDLRDAMDKDCHAKLAMMEQLADKDWVLLGEFVKKNPKWRLMDIILSRYLSEGFSFEHDYQGYGHHATSAPQEDNTSAAKTLVLKRINEEDWLMLGEFVPIVGIGYIMFTLCNFLSEVSPFEQDFLIDAHHEMPVHLQERNSGCASFDLAQNSTTSEALAGQSSNTDDQVLMNQSSGNLDSGLKPCKINPKDYPRISREDDVWLGEDSDGQVLLVQSGLHSNQNFLWC